MYSRTCASRRDRRRVPPDAESLPTENQFLSSKQFEMDVQAGLIDVHWRRPIAEDHVNRYGFSLAPELTHGGVVVLSGNNYLEWRDQPLLVSLRDAGRLMVVRVHATVETRLARLLARRPALSDPEIASRMLDVPGSTLPSADHVVPNDPLFERTAEWELVRLIAAFRFATATAGALA